MKELVYKYLGYSNVLPDDNINKLIDECINEIKFLSRFKYLYKPFTEILPFLKENENYLEYLKGAEYYFLVGCTLGIEVDIRQKYYQKIDITKALVFDCVASAYIEEVADQYEKDMNLDLSYRFCPGYQGTSFLDNQIIAKYIEVNKRLGITFLESGLMVPLKSMIGIVAVGNNKKRSCKGCIFTGDCKYLKGGTTCYKR